MLGSLLPRALLMVFGYAYPAYECYKTVENKPDIEQLLFWCHYWILVAMLTVLERVGDALFAWLPIYSEAKLALLIYLWSSKLKATTNLYNRFFRDFVAQHEAEIDRNIMELRVKTLDIANICWQKALNYGQIGAFEILQHVSSQSVSQLPHRDQFEAATRDQRTTTKFEENPSESKSAPPSENETPILPSRKRWIRKFIIR